MLYLLRLAETGREAQPQRRKLRRDVVAEVRGRLPGAKIRTGTGRIFVETGTGEDAAAALREIHGVASYSPCVWCRLDELEETAVRVAARELGGARTFRVRVKRVGGHEFNSMEKAAELGRAVAASLPHLRVDMDEPDRVLGVEIRDRECYLFTEVLPGLDRRSAPAPPREEEPRFLIDQMLGKLVGWLRLLGYDTVYVRDQPDSLLLRRAREEGRILLTRDRELSRARSVDVLFLGEESPEGQLAEMASSLGLRLEPERMFTRCALCNRPVRGVTKEQVADRLPEPARRLYEEFTFCEACDKVYWKGDQYQRIVDAVERLRSRGTEMG